MAYEIDLTDQAQQKLNHMPLWLQGIVESHLSRLANAPSTMSRIVVSPPYPPGGMISEFSHGPIDGFLHHVALFFRYSQDETRIVVQSIGYTLLKFGP